LPWPGSEWYALDNDALELRNVANVANVMEVPLNLEAIQFEVVGRPRQAVGSREPAVR